MNIFLDKRHVSNLVKWFNNYVGTFKNDDPEYQNNIDIKKKHTERVIREIINTGKGLNLNEHELRLAVIIALFHDIGRFEQYSHYNTFSDNRSEDHAELGIRILNERNVLKNLDADIKKLILCAIRNHNKPCLPPGETKICLFYSRLIRDADKLDILKVVTDYYHVRNGKRNVALELELPDTQGFSEKIYNALLNRSIADIKNVRNLNDIKLLQAAWVFDINFKPTFTFIKSRKYIELLRTALPESEKIDHLFGIIKSHIDMSII